MALIVLWFPAGSTTCHMFLFQSNMDSRDVLATRLLGWGELRRRKIHPEIIRGRQGNLGADRLEEVLDIESTNPGELVDPYGDHVYTGPGSPEPEDPGIYAPRSNLPCRPQLSLYDALWVLDHVLNDDDVVGRRHLLVVCLVCAETRAFLLLATPHHAEVSADGA